MSTTDVAENTSKIIAAEEEKGERLGRDLIKVPPAKFKDLPHQHHFDQPTMCKEEKKKYSRMWSIVHNGVRLKVDEICTKESTLLLSHWGSPNYCLDPLKIKRNILEKALDFCKKRAEIRINHRNDKKKKLLVKDFDSNFLKQTHDDAIDLVDVAGKLGIQSLFDLLFEDVVQMIARKTPQDIEKIFPIRYNGADDGADDLLNNMNFIMDCSPYWPSELGMLINQVI